MPKLVLSIKDINNTVRDLQRLSNELLSVKDQLESDFEPDSYKVLNQLNTLVSDVEDIMILLESSEVDYSYGE